jgi:hypothetical protein
MSEYAVVNLTNCTRCRRKLVGFKLAAIWTTHINSAVTTGSWCQVQPVEEDDSHHSWQVKLVGELRLFDSVEVKRFFKFPRPGSAATLGDDQHLSTPSFLLNLGGKYSKIPILCYFYTLWQSRGIYGWPTNWHLIILIKKLIYCCVQ